MNMAGMNVAAVGGPVGGMVMMNNGSPATNPVSNSRSQKEHLNTCIYEYFLKNGYVDLARKLTQDPKWEMNTTPNNIKQSPGRRKDGEMNGVDADGMDMDLKDDVPDDLPRPALPSQQGHGNGFLFDWYCIFADLFTAQRQKVQGENSVAKQYLVQTQTRLREGQQNPGMIRPGMVGPAQIAAMRGMRNGMMNGDMQKAAMAKQFTPQQLQQMQQTRMMAQQQMQREQSDMDMNGRPGTPADGENGGSPSKRPRLDGQQFNGAMGPNGRVQGMPGAQQQMLMQSGFNPNMNQAQFRPNGAMQQKAMQGQMGNGMMNMPNAGSPMLGPMSEPQFVNGVPMDIYNQRMQGQPNMQGPPGAQGGNHALQDYQMQLMLLEQQNKKRLMMARQEQDSITSRTDGPQIPGQVGMPQGMSPSGRSGTSPNPTEQMKRGTPQLGGMPGSPAAGEAMQGRSPAAMNFMNNGMPPEFNPGMFIKPNDGMVGPGPGMRPPTSMDMGAMGAMARGQPGRMPGQFPGGQPMVQQTSQGQPQPMGTPVPRNEMPPPSAPATGNANARAQPPSPQQNQAPPTPSQSNKANPKKKGKDNTDTRKKPNKKNSTANAPSDAEPAATPTPSVPISPQHPNFNSAGKGAGAQNAGPTSNPAPMQQPMQADLQNAGFPDFAGAPDQNFNLDFSTLETGDVLENFDFDSFLNTNGDDGGFGFGDGMDNFNLDPSVE